MCFSYGQVFVAGLECVGGARSAGMGERIGGLVKWYPTCGGCYSRVQYTWNLLPKICTQP